MFTHVLFVSIHNWVVQCEYITTRTRGLAPPTFEMTIVVGSLLSKESDENG